MNWAAIMINEDIGDLGIIFRKKVRHDYIHNIKNFLLECKEQSIRKMTKRADIGEVLSVQNIQREKI